MYGISTLKIKCVKAFEIICLKVVEYSYSIISENHTVSDLVLELHFLEGGRLKSLDSFFSIIS